jgi:hypothetical protein
MLDLLFAATYPERTLALLIHGSYPSARWEPEAPWGWREDEFAERLAAIERSWGTEEFVIGDFPEMAQDPELLRWFTTYTRRGASPGAVIAAERMELDTDVRDILSAIHVPTLILHRVEDDPEANRYMAEHIAGAEYVTLPGNDHIPYVGDQDSVLKEIERFVKGIQAEQASLDRVLATVLFTDVVSSTEKAAELGDSAWRDLLEQHHATVRRLLAHYRGRRLIRQAMGSLPRSMVRLVRSAARRRSWKPLRASASKFGPGFIPASARRSQGRSGVSL